MPDAMASSSQSPFSVNQFALIVTESIRHRWSQTSPDFTISAPKLVTEPHVCSSQDRHRKVYPRRLSPSQAVAYF